MKDKKLEQLMKDEFQKEVNIQFAFACLNNDLETVKGYLTNNYIDDLGYEKGLFGIYAAMNGNKDVLDILYQDPRSEELKKYQHNIFNTAASHGNINCVKFLLEQGANPKELQGTTAYNNYQAVEEIFNDYEVNQIKLSGNNHQNDFIDQNS
jgi:ankyrin repeat protein